MPSNSLVIRLRNLKWLSLRWIFPGLLISSTCNQQEKYNLLMVIGSVTSILNVMAAIVIAWFVFRKKSLILLVIFGFLLTKTGRIVFGDQSYFLGGYIIFVGILFCIAGSVAAFQFSRLIYRQVILFCLFSIPLMLLQLIGVGEWTQFHRTDIDNLEYGLTQFPTLFVGVNNVVINGLQVRPSGFCWANNFLSIVIMFALGLHYGKLKSHKITWKDAVLCAITVLAMAKIVFLAFGVIILWLLIFGESWKKKRIIKNILLFFSLMVSYALFFPGVFLYNTSLSLWYKNFMGRKIDFIRSISANPMFLKAGLDNNTMPQVSGHESGYAEIATVLPYLSVVGLFIVIYLIKGLKKMRYRFPDLKNTSVLIFLVLILMPLITSFLQTNFFWFVAGFAFLPIFLLMGSKYFQLLPRSQ